MKINHILSVVLLISLAGCSPPDENNANKEQANKLQNMATLQMDEQGVMKSVGREYVGKYDLENGYGFKFRTDSQPPFSIEFREGYINVAWSGSEFQNEKNELLALHNENNKLANQVLVYVLGSDLSNSIMDSVKNNKPAVIKLGSGQINVSPGGMQNLVSITSK